MNLLVPINLNKIDPVIINDIQKQTRDEIVHNFEGIKITNDSNEKQKDREFKEKLKKKLSKVNSMLKEKNINASLRIEGDYVIAVDKDNNVLISYGKDRFEELSGKLETLIGIFIDDAR